MSARSQKRAAVALQSLFHAMVAPKPEKPPKAPKPPQFTEQEAMLQRVHMLAARGNLTQVQAAQVIGMNVASWNLMENGHRRCPTGMLDTFRTSAAARFPHYRCDLKRI